MAAMAPGRQAAARRRGLRATLRAAFASPTVVYPPPPLRWQQSIGRYAAILLFDVLAWGQVADQQWQHHRWLFILDPILGAVALVAVHWRRRWPLPIGVLCGLLAGISSIAVGPALLAMVSVCTRRRWNEIGVLAAIALLTSWSYWAIQPDQQTETLLAELAFAVVIAAVAIAIGLYTGARRDLEAQEQQRRVSDAQLGERERIAREMHDVLAHRISRIAMHAGALAYREDLDPAATRQAAEVIRADAHGALEDLRSVLGMLRAPAVAGSESLAGPGAPVAERPQPTLADIDELIAGARTGGMVVSLERVGPPLDGIADQTGRSAYRIVQESLTNAAKHAPGVPVLVRLGRTVRGGASPDSRGELVIEVRNRLPRGPVAAPPGSGLGLLGLDERAALANGRIEHGVRGMDFVVEAWLPCGAGSVAAGQPAEGQPVR